MAGIPPSIIVTQDSHRRTHLHHQATTMDSPPQPLDHASKQDQAMPHGREHFVHRRRRRSCKTKHASPTSLVSLTTSISRFESPQDREESQRQQKLLDESSRRKIEKRGRGNRSCSMNPERRRTNSKNIGTFSPKISRKDWQPTTTSSPSPSSQTSSGQYRTSIHIRLTS